MREHRNKHTKINKYKTFNNQNKNLKKNIIKKNTKTQKKKH